MEKREGALWLIDYLVECEGVLHCFVYVNVCVQALCSPTICVLSAMVVMCLDNAGDQNRGLWCGIDMQSNHYFCDECWI